MRTRFSSHLSPRTARPVSAADLALEGRAPMRASWKAARRLTLALAASAPLCAGALLSGPAQAAPTVESDENGPLVQIIKPGYNDVLKGKYRILIQVTARKYNPQSVEMFIDDESATTGPMEISSFASSSYDFDTRLLSEGRHKLTVRVTDSQGFAAGAKSPFSSTTKASLTIKCPTCVGLASSRFRNCRVRLSSKSTPPIISASRCYRFRSIPPIRPTNRRIRG